MTREEAIRNINALNAVCGQKDFYDKGFEEALEIAIKALEQEPKTGHWIPVSERLPEKTGLYLISIGDLVTTTSFDGHNFRTQAMVRFIPDAWMPLPESYKEGEEE